MVAVIRVLSKARAEHSHPAAEPLVLYQLDFPAGINRHIA